MTPVKSQLQKQKQQQAAATKPPTLMSRVETVVYTAASMKIDSAAACVKASGTLREAALLKREIEAVYKAKRQPLLQEQKRIIEEERQFTSLLEQTESVLSGAIKEFRRKDAEDRAKKEADERAKREQAAREEAQLRADQLRAAAAAAPSKSVARRLEAQAAIVENAQPVIDPIAIEDAPVLLGAGLHSKKSVHGAVDDLEALVLQVAAGIMLKKFAGEKNPHVAAFLSVFKPNAQATLAVLQPSMPRINSLAQDFPSDLELAGVRVEEDETFVARK
jgi:hypothetical protein